MATRKEILRQEAIKRLQEVVTIGVKLSSLSYEDL